MTLVRALFVFAILILPATSFAVPTAGVPTAGVVVSGVNGPIDISANVSLNLDGTFTASLDVSQPGLFNIIDLEIVFDPDPFIEYSLGGVKNFTAGPLTFTFLFLTPFGGGPYSTLSSSHASVVTDGTVPDGTVRVDPSGGTFIHRPQINLVETAVGQLGDGCTVSGSPGFSDFCEAGSGTFLISPVSGPGTLGVTVAFTLSPGDLYAASGRVELLDSNHRVPEPSTLILGLSVLAGILYRQRRR